MDEVRSPEARGTPESQHVDLASIARIAFVALACAAVWFRVWEPFSRLSVIGIVAALVGMYPILREAFEAIQARRMTMELSMTIAIGAALAIGQFFTGLVIVLFVLIAEVLEGLTVERGRRAIKDLLVFLPQIATVRRNGEARDVNAAEIRIDDLIIVKPGGRIPVDGEVVAGDSFVDQATITGESLPVEKAAGDRVFAGTINQSGALEIQTTGIGRETAFGKIIETVEAAERSRAPIQKTADRLAGYLVYFALGCAVVTFLLTRNVRSTISVIIVAGACGIAAGTPLAILGAVGRAAREGAIVKGGLYIELLSQVDTVVLDKTGTVTFGEPDVVAVNPAPGVTADAVLEAAAIAERPSEHALARAVLKRAREANIPLRDPDSFSYTPGRGVVCTADGDEIVVGNRAFLTDRDVNCGDLTESPGSEILVGRNGNFLGTLQVSDTLRPEAVQAVKALHRMGLRTILLTGDSKAVANFVGSELNVDEVDAELLPNQKLDRIEALRAEGRKVVMVGDGINDAPALIRANVGVAMGSGTDVARESANIMLLGNDLSRFVETVRIARRCHRIIIANFTGTLLVDGVGVALAAFGMLNPLLAAFIHVSSELAFILNSARLLPQR